MAEVATGMLREAVGALLDEHVDGALHTIRQDRQVDKMNRDNIEAFTAAIMADPGSAAGYLDLIFITRSLERIGDHAANISEEVIYLLSGAEVRHTGLKKAAPDSLPLA